MVKTYEAVWKLGTAWVAPGEGAMVANILDALLDVPDSITKVRAITRLRIIAGYQPFTPDTLRQRTNLQLNGTPLAPYDLDRIAECEV